MSVCIFCGMNISVTMTICAHTQGNIEPINAGESGIDRLPAGVKMDTMYRPPTADVKEAFRQGGCVCICVPV